MSDTLPPLPEPELWVDHETLHWQKTMPTRPTYETYYTADQMRAYALAARQQAPAQPELLCRLQTHGATLHAGDDPRITCTAEQAALAILDVTGVDVEWEARQQAQVPEGFVLVPVEPTPEMCAAGFCVSEAEHDPAGVYRAMLAAAPQAAQPEPSIDRAMNRALHRSVNFLDQPEPLQRDLLTELMDHAFNDGQQDLDSPSSATQEAERRFRASCRSEQAQQSERERFEDWFSRDVESDLNPAWGNRTREGKYTFPDVQEAWEAWQAAHASILARLEAVPLPEPEPHELVKGSAAPNYPFLALARHVEMMGRYRAAMLAAAKGDTK